MCDGDFAFVDVPRIGWSTTSLTSEIKIQVENLIQQHPPNQPESGSQSTGSMGNSYARSIYRRVCSVLVSRIRNSKSGKGSALPAIFGQPWRRCCSALCCSWNPSGRSQVNHVWLRANEKRHRIPRPTFQKKNLCLPSFTLPMAIFRNVEYARETKDIIEQCSQERKVASYQHVSDFV